MLVTPLVVVAPVTFSVVVAMSPALLMPLVVVEPITTVPPATVSVPASVPLPSLSTWKVSPLPLLTVMPALSIVTIVGALLVLTTSDLPPPPSRTSALPSPLPVTTAVSTKPDPTVVDCSEKPPSPIVPLATRTPKSDTMVAEYAAVVLLASPWIDALPTSRPWVVRAVPLRLFTLTSVALVVVLNFAVPVTAR